MIFKSKIIKSFLIMFVIACAAFYISNNWFQLMLIQGDSMIPAYRNMQLVVIDKRFHEVRSGDVVAFYSKKLNCVLVKRVAAIPGDTVQIKNNSLYINNKSLENTFLSFAGIVKEPIFLKEDEYFMLGDNREASKDSRYEEIGNIRKKAIIGRVLPQKCRNADF